MNSKCLKTSCAICAKHEKRSKGTLFFPLLKSSIVESQVAFRSGPLLVHISTIDIFFDLSSFMTYRENCLFFFFFKGPFVEESDMSLIRLIVQVSKQKIHILRISMSLYHWPPMRLFYFLKIGMFFYIFLENII